MVDWGAGAKAWFQYAARNEKRVTAILPSEYELPFPGFAALQLSLSQITSLPSTWRNALSSVGGVYLLVDSKSGDQYVGIAHGENGFLGRWEQYAKNGHGGTKLLRKRSKRDYQVSVLEVVSSPSTPNEVIQREALWKQKLGSRAFGLNSN